MNPPPPPGRRAFFCWVASPFLSYRVVAVRPYFFSRPIIYFPSFSLCSHKPLFFLTVAPFCMGSRGSWPVAMVPSEFSCCVCATNKIPHVRLHIHLGPPPGFTSLLFLVLLRLVIYLGASSYYRKRARALVPCGIIRPDRMQGP